MVIVPKDHFKERLFVGRKGHIQIFRETVGSIGQKKFNVLVYYGVPGVGKTSLRKELLKSLEEYNFEYQYCKTIWASIDLKLEEYRERATFLVILKNELQRRAEINFASFEIAHAVYWKKANPEIPLRKENYLFFESYDSFDNFFEVIDKIPYFSVVPATARLLKKFPDYFRKWWSKRGGAELAQLTEKEPLEIEEMLPYFWAQDLNNYLEGASKSAVIFIDTYEALLENHKNEGYSRDEWIREELIPRLPKNVLWVICGRERLRWEGINSEWSEYITQYEVEELSKEFCIEYLETLKITDKKIQEAIFKGSRGIPYYLNLSADVYEKIAEIREPQPEDFGDNYPIIADRFFRYLSLEEKRLLSVISVLRYWDNSLLEYLIKELNTGASLIDYENLSSISFINRGDNNKFQMHHLMKESLKQNLEKENPEFAKRVHKVTNEYYSNKLENLDIKAISLEQENALTEAFYHAKESFDAEDMFNWFVKASEPFYKAAFWQLIVPMYEEMTIILEEKLGPKHPSVATSLNNLALFYNKMGDYEKAFIFFQRALEIYEEVDPQHPDIAKTLNNLALLYYKLEDYEKALPIYQRTLEIYEKVLGPQHPDVAVTLNNLALFYEKMGDYERALTLSQRALEIYEEVLDPQHPSVATTLNNLALFYYKMGDYERALILSQRALGIYEKALGPQHPDITAILNNLALFYDKMGDYEKALPIYQRTLEIYEKVLGPQHPDVAVTLNNLALFYEKMGDYERALTLSQRALEIYEKVLGLHHPSVAKTQNNLAEIYHSMGDYESELILSQRALEIYEKVLGPQHPDVAVTLNNLALFYDKMGDYERALILSQRALEIYEKVLGLHHPSVAKSLNNLAEIYHSMGDYEKALPCFKRALEIYEKALGPQHPDVAVTLNNLAELYESIGDYEIALSLCHRANNIFRNSFGDLVPPSVGIVSRNLARVLTKINDYKSKDDTNSYDFKIEDEKITSIEKISLEKYRECLTATEFEFGKVNLLFGPNGSGKTSLLEAIELFFCGKNLRNPEKLYDYKIKVRFKGSLNYQDMSTNTNKKYNLRDMYWYNNPYDPNKNSSDLHIGFNRYNFYNTDSAFILFNEKKSGKVKKAFEDITLGENVNYIEERINKYHDEFETRLNECDKLLFEYKELFNKEKEMMQKITEINLEYLREEFIEEARRIKWAKNFDEISLSVLTDFKIDYNKVKMYLSKVRENIKWIKSPTVEILKGEKNELNRIKSQIDFIDLNIEENKEKLYKLDLSLNSIDDKLTDLNNQLKDKGISFDEINLEELFHITQQHNQQISRIKNEIMNCKITMQKQNKIKEKITEEFINNFNLMDESSENLNENNLDILIKEKIEQINNSIQLINNLSKIIYISSNDSLDEVILNLESLYTTFRELKAEMNQNRAIEIQNEKNKLRIKEIKSKIDELEKNRIIIQKGKQNLSNLLKTHGKEKYLQDFLLNNNKEIFRIFNSIHTPKEFRVLIDSLPN